MVRSCLYVSVRHCDMRMESTRVSNLITKSAKPARSIRRPENAIMICVKVVAMLLDYNLVLVSFLPPILGRAVRALSRRSCSCLGGARIGDGLIRAKNERLTLYCVRLLWNGGHPEFFAVDAIRISRCHDHLDLGIFLKGRGI